MSFDFESYCEHFKDEAFKKYRIRIDDRDPILLEYLMTANLFNLIKEEMDQTILMHEERLSDIAEKWQQREKNIADNFTGMLNKQKEQINIAATGVFKDAMQKAVDLSITKIRENFISQNLNELNAAIKWIKVACTINVVAITAGAISLCCMLYR